MIKFFCGTYRGTYHGTYRLDVCYNIDMFIRHKNNPILKPDAKIPWMKNKVYNPGIYFDGQIYHMFFRALGSGWVSKIGYAVSTDGINFNIDKHPVIEPELHIEKNGVEDPRITKIDHKYYLTYTAYDGETARLYLATSTDLREWTRHGEMLPDWDNQRAHSFSVNWDAAAQTEQASKSWLKAGAIFPRIINGKYWMLFGDRNIWLASSLDGVNWAPIWEPFLKPKNCAHLEMGPPPIQTKKGWLVLYHQIDHKRTYRLNYLLLDNNDPTKIIFKSTKTIFEPKTAYELHGIIDVVPGGLGKLSLMTKQAVKKFMSSKKIPRVVFCPGAVLVNEKLRIYYGAGDTSICMAEIDIGKLFV